MKWVTYLDADGERTGVLSGDAIYAMPAGVTLLDLIWEKFCQAGRVKRWPQPSSWPPLR